MVLWGMCGFEWAFTALSNEIMCTAYLGIFVRAGIMGLLKLYNCILLFLSFNSPFLLWLIPHSPSAESPFFFCFTSVQQIWSPFIMQINLIPAEHGESDWGGNLKMN